MNFKIVKSDTIWFMAVHDTIDLLSFKLIDNDSGNELIEAIAERKNSWLLVYWVRK